MVSVGAYLRKLLYQYDCVVVPELGGFLTHYQPATFNAETGQFLPPRKRLAFNEALRLDDGILINYMMLHESLSRDEATRTITTFVTNLKQHVQLAGSFSVEGIGLFTPNSEGKLQFDPELRHNFFSESFGMAAIQAERVNAIPVESVEAEEVPPMYALGPLLQEEILEEGPFVRVARPRPLLRWAAAAVLIISLGAISYLTVIEPGQPMESSLNPANWLRVPAWLASSAKPGSEPAKGTVVIRPTAPINKPVATFPATINSAQPTEAVKEDAPVATPIATETPAVKPVVKAPTLATAKASMVKPKSRLKTEVVEAPVAEPKARVEVALAETVTEVPEQLEVKRFEGTLFTVIAGSFASRPNAIRFRRSLQKAGYSDAYIIQPNRGGQLYKVAAIGSPVREEAIASTDSLKKLTGITPFIIKN